MIDSVNIPKIIKTQSTGDNDSVAQAFSQNRFVKISPQRKNVFYYENPVYNIEGASYKYYEQDLRAISYNLNNGKQYTLNFTANTTSISGLTMLKHELYRITYDDYKSALLNVGTSAYTQTIQDNVNIPITTITDYATGDTGVANSIIGSRLTKTFPIQIKPDGGFTIDLFKDKSQYFIHPKFIFPKAVDPTIGQIQVISGATSGTTSDIDSNNVIVTLKEYQDEPYEYLESALPEHIITGATPFSGLTIRGACFTYFVPPIKPNLEVGGGDGSNPVVGKQTTFSPTWNFNNVADGDYYRLQVTYDITDYTFTDESKTNFYINKQDGDAEHVRTYSTPLTPNKKFLYRIGNTKEIINIFGVKQSLTTWTNYVEAETANDGKYTVSGTCFQNFISRRTFTADTFGVYSIENAGSVMSGVTLELIGTYSNSSIDLSVDTKTDKTIFSPINAILDTDSSLNTITVATSDENGTFDFGRVDGGTYVLRIIPPPGFTDAYSTEARVINISQDTDLDIILGIIWGNNIIDFNFPATFL